MLVLERRVHPSWTLTTIVRKQAKRSDTDSDDGYPWLAFSWDNFRLSAQRANQINHDDATDETVGKVLGSR